MAQIMYSWLHLTSSLQPTSVRFVGWFIKSRFWELCILDWYNVPVSTLMFANFWKAQSIEPKNFSVKSNSILSKFHFMQYEERKFGPAINMWAVLWNQDCSVYIF